MRVAGLAASGDPGSGWAVDPVAVAADRFAHDRSPESVIPMRSVVQGQLVAAGVVSRDTLQPARVVTSSKNGFPWQASVGASVEEYEFVKENQQVTVNGKQQQGPVNVVRKSTLG